jgi:hypothetical protein
MPSRFALALVVPMLAAAPALAEPIEIDWGQLIPGNEAMTAADVPMGIIEHGALAEDAYGNEYAVTTAFNGKQIRMPGFVVPLDYAGTEVQEFLLVPYVGACIHVPPPPPNQIVFVTAREPVEITGMFDAVWVTGTLNTLQTSTELAEIGYRLVADEVEPYEE